jgi:hypothetical protein
MSDGITNENMQREQGNKQNEIEDRSSKTITDPYELYIYQPCIINSKMSSDICNRLLHNVEFLCSITDVTTSILAGLGTK